MAIMGPLADGGGGASVWATTSVVNQLQFGYSPTSTWSLKSLLVTALQWALPFSLGIPLHPNKSNIH